MHACNATNASADKILGQQGRDVNICFKHGRVHDMNQNNSFQVLLRKSGFKPIKSNHGLQTHRCVMILGRPRSVHLEIRCAEKHSVLVLRFEGEWHWGFRTYGTLQLLPVTTACSI